jgi:TnpA family transposase
MAVDFLTDEQKARYGRFADEINEVQLIRYFHLDEAALSLIRARRGEQNRFGFALQLTSVRFLGAFLSDLKLVPINIQAFIAKQLLIRDVGILTDYAQRETTKREHTMLIRKHYGYHDFNEQPWAFRLTRLLYAKAWISNERPSLMFDFATAWLIQNKILLPGASTISRLISEIRERSYDRLWLRLSSLPTSEQKSKLETLLEVPEGMRTSRFDQYRKGPTAMQMLDW